MTNDQFNYIHKRMARSFKSQNLTPMTRTELRGFMGLLGVTNEMDIRAHEFSDALILQTNQLMSEIMTSNVVDDPDRKLDTELLSQFINLEEE